MAGKPKEEPKETRRVGPKNVNIPILKRLPMPHEHLIPRTDTSPSEFVGPPNYTSPSKSDDPVVINGPVESSGPLVNDSPLKSIRPLEINSPSDSTIPAHRSDGPPESNGPLEISSAMTGVGPSDIAALSYDRRPANSLLNSLPDETGYMQAFHQITDHLDRHLTPAEQSGYRHLLRLTWGFGKAKTIVSVPKLAERINLGDSAMRIAIKGLESKGLIKKVRHVFGSNEPQGIEFEVYAPLALVRYMQAQARRRRPQKTDGPLQSGGPLQTDGIKESVSVSKTINTQTQPGVGVGSRFTLEQCRRYADHLKATGQGITNPGGYATKIFRSGEADTLIESFLNPPAPLDASRCPDCQGRGFAHIDPDNFDLGVRPCKHPRLR